MKKKALALAVAGAFFAPASYAAQDTSGMQYTSAAEGFYASIRAQFSTESRNGGGAGIGGPAGATVGGEQHFSRFGIRGSNDLGNGLQGFYQYEAGVSSDNNGGLVTRLAHVGLEGAFGRVWAGSGWVETHNMTYGATDIGNFGGGNLSYTDLRPGRDNDVIQYRTPDIGGFQGALGIKLAPGAENNQHTAANGNSPGDDNNVDMWSAAGMYNVQGFTAAFAYSVRPDTTKWNNADVDAPAADGTADHTAWTARLGYAQDNWHVNGWYGRDNTTDIGTEHARNAAMSRAGRVIEDARYASISGGVAVGAVNLYGVFEAGHNGSDNAEAHTLIGVQYNLGSQSRVWMNYLGKNFDVQGDTEDSIAIGLRHDF